MKSLAVILGIITLLTFKYEEKTEWYTNYNSALTTAKEQNKNLLIYFTGSDWCAPCIQLKNDLFEEPEFKELSSHYVKLYIDIPRRNDVISSDQKAHNREIFKKFNEKGMFPLFVALSPSGEVLDKYSGYSMNGEIGYHLEFLRKNK